MAKTADNTISEQKPEKTEPETPVKNVAENPKKDQEIVTCIVSGAGKIIQRYQGIPQVKIITIQQNT